METLDLLQSIYDSQVKKSSGLQAEIVLSSAKSSLKKLKKDQYWTVAILSATLLVLVYFFYEIGQFGGWNLILALSLMVISLGIRVILEVSSRFRLRRLKPHLSTNDFINSIHSYYRSRKRIQYVFTPIIYLIYGIGIILLLVSVHPYLSSFFFAYCMVTGIGFWTGFIWVIRRSYQNECKLLEELVGMQQKN